MTTVRILVDYVGSRMAGDIVIDAPAGLVNMAEQKAKHAVTGELLAEIVSDPVGSGIVDSDEIQEAIAIIKEIRSSAFSLDITDAETLSITQLIDAIAKVSFSRLEKEKADNELLLKQRSEQELVDATELASLKEKAKELKIAGCTKMDIAELKVAIAAAGGESDGK